MEENRERFDEIRCNIRDLLEEALDLVPELNKARASSYWYAQISTSLDADHDFLGGSMCSMQDTLDEWEEEEENYNQ